MKICIRHHPLANAILSFQFASLTISIGLECQLKHVPSCGCALELNVNLDKSLSTCFYQFESPAETFQRLPPHEMANGRCDMIQTKSNSTFIMLSSSLVLNESTILYFIVVFNTNFVRRFPSLYQYQSIQMVVQRNSINSISHWPSEFSFIRKFNS